MTRSRGHLDHDRDCHGLGLRVHWANLNPGPAARATGPGHGVSPGVLVAVTRVAVPARGRDGRAGGPY